MLSGCSPAGQEPAPNTTVPPNIVFIFADDLSWVHLGAYGSDEVRTPNLNRLAREGVVFENAFILHAFPGIHPHRQERFRTGRGRYAPVLLVPHGTRYPDLYKDPDVSPGTCLSPHTWNVYWSEADRCRVISSFRGTVMLPSAKALHFDQIANGQPALDRFSPQKSHWQYSVTRRPLEQRRTTRFMRFCDCASLRAE